MTVTDPTHRFVDAGAGGRPTPIAAVARELLDLLARLVPYESACISVYDPLSRSHRTMGSLGPGADAPAWLDSWTVEVDAAHPETHDSGAYPLSWTDDGVTLRLYSGDGRYTGSLHLAPADVAADREAIADQLMRVRSLVGGLIDTMRAPSQLTADVPAGARGAVVLPDATVVPLPDRLTGPHLRDGEPLPVAISDAARRGDVPERFRWRDPLGGWHLIHCRPLVAGFVITEEDTGLPYGLTPRELEVLTLIARGYTNPKIARTLVVSDKTVAKHVEHVLDKLGCASRAAAAAAAVRGGLIELTADCPR